MQPDHEVNRRSWEQLAALHGQDAYYDTEALLSGVSSLIEEEESALSDAAGSLEGRSVLHLQCHLGFDAITFARRGAHVTGVDFSPTALARAGVLAESCDVTINWVCADACDLPDSLHRRFDLVWATMGIVCWISDMRAWMRQVAAVLLPGGKLVLMDGSPRPEPITRRVVQSGWDYASDARTGPQVQFGYTLDAIAAAAREAGLTIEHLRKHTDVSTDLCVDGYTLESDGRYRCRIDGDPQPALFTMIAVR